MMHMTQWCKDSIAKLKNRFNTNPTFWECEVQANVLVAKTMILTAAIFLLSWILDYLSIFKITDRVMTPLTIHCLAELLIPAVTCLYLKGEKKWLKYFMLLEFIIVLARVDSILTYSVVLIILIPIVLSCRYYSGVFTVQIAVITTFFFALFDYFGAYFGFGQVDENLYDINRAIYARNIMLQAFLPKCLIGFVISTVCVEIARVGKAMVEKQDTVSRQNERIETELDMAKKIQESALPPVGSVVKNRGDLFDLAAFSVPAKEVGGDFYDFLYIDSSHLAIVIADVSGKGVPAALFMMISKLLLDDSLHGAVSPAKVLTEVNHQLCEKHLEDMFVTAWLGILDLENGKMIASNAGHEYPIICKNNGEFEAIKDRHGLVLGGMDGVRYTDYELELGLDDILFVYTDGVMEANNSQNELFGMDRTLDALNRHKGETLDDLLRNMKREIDDFAGEAAQFDDTSMMAIRMKQYYNREGITVSMPYTRSYDSVVQAVNYVKSRLTENEIDEGLCKNIEYLVEKIFDIILDYSSADYADLVCDICDTGIVVKIIDNGLPYDYSKKPGERTKEILKECHVEYERAGDYNNLTLAWDRI